MGDYTVRELEINYCVCVCHSVYRESGIEKMCDELETMMIQYGATRDEVRAEILHLGGDASLSTEEKVYLMTRQFK